VRGGDGGGFLKGRKSTSGVPAASTFGPQRQRCRDVNLPGGRDHDALPRANLDLQTFFPAGVAELADATDSKFLKQGFHGVLSR
jgi:hypothetical protein